MRIAHLSTYPLRGGAARAMLRLDEALFAAGIESSVYVRHCDRDEPRVFGFVPQPTWRSRWTRFWRTRKLARLQQRLKLRPGQEVFTPARAPYGAELANRLATSVDLVHLHWVANFVDLPEFLAHLPASIPVVWTLHDLQPATGGCHYTGGCRRLETGCGCCPQLGSTDADDLSAEAWRLRRDVLGAQTNRPWRIVAPSNWMNREVVASKLAPANRVVTLPYGIDSNVFSPRHRKAAREMMSLPGDAAIVLFIADQVDQRRKGADLLQAALGRVTTRPNQSRILLIVGRGNLPPVAGWEIRSLGSTENDIWLTSAYAASDVVAVPSREDNSPLTVIEAMACGRTVAAFGVGGLVDLIQHEQTGWLAEPESVAGYATCLSAALSGDRFVMEAAARGAIEQRRTLARHAQDHRQLYEELLRR
jgi:glycosyltransferase involved in cell wall biosynthesis